MISEETINRGGSKLEITRYILEHDLDIPVPRSIWKYAGESLDPLKSEFEKFKKPVIVRGSHPNDLHGYIDVIPTFRGIDSFSRLEKAVREIERVAASHKVKTHALDWGQEFTPEVHVLIQEQNPSGQLGSMLKHPHSSDIRIQYRDLEDYRCGGTYIYAVFNEEKRKIYHGGSSFVNQCKEVKNHELRRLADIYRKLIVYGVLDPEWAYQVEFGLKPLQFFQARPFKKIVPEANFSLPSIPKKGVCLWGWGFGITPKEGIDLPFFAPGDYKDLHRKVRDRVEGYGLITSSRPQVSPDPGIRFHNLKVYCSSSPLHQFLEHGNYRLMKRADFSIVNYSLYNAGKTVLQSGNWQEYDSVIKQLLKDSRFFCNGDQGMIIPKKYL
ncbi:MAG: hypothetical protein WCV90_08585 [Candidatus Woesearchaeota archaeon]|jgi:hypothetical protein